MSGTDKTNPARVRGARGETTQWPHHSYECLQGHEACTLPPQSPVTPLRPTTPCFWAASDAIAKGGKRKSTCGCAGLCTQQPQRKASARRERHGKRAAIAEQLT